MQKEGKLKEGSSPSRKKQSQKYHFLYNTTIIQRIDNRSSHQTPHFPIHITKQHLGCVLTKFSRLRNPPTRSSIIKHTLNIFLFNLYKFNLKCAKQRSNKTSSFDLKKLASNCPNTQPLYMVL